MYTEREGMWLLNQMGNKDRSLWSSLFVVKGRTPSGSYKLMEVDGSLLADLVAAIRLKPYWFRGQIMKDVVSKKVTGTTANKLITCGQDTAPHSNTKENSSDAEMQSKPQ